MFPTRRIITSGGDVTRDQYSLAFDGSDESVDLASPFQSTFRSSSSISCWFKANDGRPDSASQALFGARDGDSRVYFYIEQGGGDDGKLFCILDVEGTTINAQSNAAVLTDGQQPWKHLVLIIDGAENQISMYLDGSFVTLDGTNDGDIGSTDIDDFRSAKNMRVGAARNNDGFALGYVGKISDWALYNTALTSSQVVTLYNDREPYNHKEGIAGGNLVGWWRMGDGIEEGAGTTIYDMSANAINGTMTNMEATDFTGDAPK